MQTPETKLLLLQQIRDRYQENIIDMGRRERILYGQNDSRIPDKPFRYEKNKTISGNGYFMLRLILACILLGMVIYLDQKGIKMVGITSEKIFEVISTNVSIDWPAL